MKKLGGNKGLASELERRYIITHCKPATVRTRFSCRGAEEGVALSGIHAQAFDGTDLCDGYPPLPPGYRLLTLTTPVGMTPTEPRDEHCEPGLQGTSFTRQASHMGSSHSGHSDPAMQGSVAAGSPEPTPQHTHAARPAQQPGEHTHPSAHKQKGPSAQPVSNQGPGVYGNATGRGPHRPQKQHSQAARSGAPGRPFGRRHTAPGAQPGSGHHQGSQGQAGSRGGQPATSNGGSGRRPVSAGQNKTYAHVSSLRQYAMQRNSAHGQSPMSRHGAGGPHSGRPKNAAHTGWPKHHPKKKKRTPIFAVRKKSPPKKMDTFSSHSGGAGWSSY